MKRKSSWRPRSYYPSTALADARADRNDAAMATVIEAAEARGWVCVGDLMPPRSRLTGAFKRLPAERRFALTTSADESGCWLWLGSVKENGYGQFRYRRPDGRVKNGYAHRASHQFFKGAIPDDLHIDHLCLNKVCVNPDHLEAVTRQENTKRYGDTFTECPKGHAYEATNTRPKGNRKTCKACHNDRTGLKSAKRHTLHTAAARNPRIKLADGDIAEMKRLRSTGVPVKDVAAAFGVTAKYASAVIAGSRQRRRRYTGPGAQAMRIVRARSEDRCEFPECAAAAEHTHHRRPRRIGSTRRPETNLPANLVRLCSTHHEWIESNRTDALAMGLLLHDNAVPTDVPCRTRHGVVLLLDDGEVIAQ